MRSTSAHHVPAAAALALALALALGACSTGDVAVQSPATTPSGPTAPAESEPAPTPSSSGVDSSPEADDSPSSGSVVVQDGEVVAGGVVVVNGEVVSGGGGGDGEHDKRGRQRQPVHAAANARDFPQDHEVEDGDD